MIKVVLDANQFVSAILTPKGNPAQIFNLIINNKIKLLVSHSIIEEVKRVLVYPHIKKIHQLETEAIEKYINKWIRFASFRES